MPNGPDFPVFSDSELLLEMQASTPVLPVADNASRVRLAVMVLGMHRSGTSALTHALSLGGLTAPRRMLEPNGDNPEGFWEPEAVVALNDRLLAEFGQDWMSYGSIPLEALQSEDLAPLRQTGREILSEEFGDAERFVIKDPRISRLMPFWRLVLEDMGVEARYVCCIRHPMEVARSLARRDGLDVLHCLRLWTDHVVAADLCSAGSRRSMVHFDAFVDDPAGTVERVFEALALGPVTLTGEVRAAIAKVVRPELRHHLLPGAAMEIAKRTVELTSAVYASLSRRDEAVGPEVKAEWLALCALDAPELAPPAVMAPATVQKLGPPTPGEPPDGVSGVDLPRLLTMLASTQDIVHRLLEKEAARSTPEYNGHVDRVSGGLLMGWCCSSSSSERVRLRVRIGDRSYGPQLAALHRRDLPGDGYYAFCIDLRDLLGSGSSVVSVSTWDGRFTLNGSGRTIDELIRG